MKVLSDSGWECFMNWGQGWYTGNSSLDVHLGKSQPFRMNSYYHEDNGDIMKIMVMRVVMDEIILCHFVTP